MFNGIAKAARSRLLVCSLRNEEHSGTCLLCAQSSTASCIDAVQTEFHLLCASRELVRVEGTGVESNVVLLLLALPRVLLAVMLA